MTDLEKKVREEASEYAKESKYEHATAWDEIEHIYITVALPREKRIAELEAEKIERNKAIVHQGILFGELIKERDKLLAEKEIWGNEFNAVIICKEKIAELEAELLEANKEALDDEEKLVRFSHDIRSLKLLLSDMNALNDKLRSACKVMREALDKSPCTGNGEVHLESCFKCARLAKADAILGEK